MTSQEPLDIDCFEIAAGRCRRDSGSLQDSADRGRVDPVAQRQELAPDPLISPAGVVSGHLLDERCDSGIQGWASRLVRVGPVHGYESAMPGQDRGRGDQPMQPQRSWQSPDQRGEEEPISPVQLRFRIAPSQDRVLVPQDENLRFQARTASSKDGHPVQEPAERKVEQSHRHGPDHADIVTGRTSTQVKHHDRVKTPHRCRAIRTPVSQTPETM